MRSPHCSVVCCLLSFFIGGHLAGQQLQVVPAPLPDSSRADEEKPLVVFAVRHAEKVATGQDPELSETGKERANQLASLLRSAEIDGVHSTDYMRTKSTAAPTAAQFEVEVAIYDPRDLPALIAKLRKTGGQHLVVGHSNTTPELARLLDGKPVKPIDEQGEYDRLYVITVGNAGRPQRVLLRYGKPSKVQADVPDREQEPNR